MTLPLSYNWRNLWVRRLSSGLTFVVVAAVVLVLSVLLSFAAGIRAAIVTSGHPQNIIVLKPGATAESTSVILPEEASKLVSTNGIAKSPTGELLISPELSIQATIPRRGPGDRSANVAVRGVDDIALLLHPEVRLVEGRWPRQGAPEAAVGKAASDRFVGLSVGDTVQLGRSANRGFDVVGVFEAGGSAFESEIWAPRTILMDGYERRFLSSVVLRVDSPEALQPAMDYINSASVQLDARPEIKYYQELSDRTAQIVQLATILVAIMALGAIFAVANTMYAAVDGRRREIAMLRTIGFSRASIILAFVIESVILCLLACVAGLSLTLLFRGYKSDFMSDTTFTVTGYELKMTPEVIGSALLSAVAVGVLGAIAPALRAARVRIVEALRRA